MNKLKVLSLVVCLAFILSSCLDNTGTEPTVPTEPGGKTNYYITNQSGSDLNVTYKTTDTYSSIDSTVTVPADSSIKIYTARAIGLVPYPSYALANLGFYKLSGNTSSPLLTIDPVVDDNWNIGRENEKKGTATTWTLTLTQKDLN
jgi:hypothetical protein